MHAMIDDVITGKMNQLKFFAYHDAVVLWCSTEGPATMPPKIARQVPTAPKATPTFEKSLAGAMEPRL